MSIPLAHREVLSFPVRYLADLPLPTTLWGVGQLLPEPMALTTSRSRYEALSAEGKVVFSPVEYEAMLAGAEAGRATMLDLARWCSAKLEQPGFRVTASLALDGARPVAPPKGFWWDGAGAGGGRGAWLEHGWTWELFINHFGVELVDVVVEAKPAASAATEAA